MWCTPTQGLPKRISAERSAVRPGRRYRRRPLLCGGFVAGAATVNLLASGGADTQVLAAIDDAGRRCHPVGH